MINQPQHEALEARLAQQVKFNPALAAKIEYATGLDVDCRVEHGSIGEPYESSNTEAC